MINIVLLQNKISIQFNSMQTNRISLDQSTLEGRPTPISKPIQQYSNQYSFLSHPLYRDQFQQFYNHLQNLYSQRKPLLPRVAKNKPQPNHRIEDQIHMIKGLLQKSNHARQSQSLHTQSGGRSYDHFLPYSSPPLIVPVPYSNRISQFENNQMPIQKPAKIEKQDKQPIDTVKPKREEPEVNKETKPIKKSRVRKSANKFRVVAYAIYFCIFFPQFATNFTKFRKNYCSKRKPTYQPDSPTLASLCNQIDLQNEWKQIISSPNSELLLNWQKLTNTALVPYSTLSENQILALKSSQLQISSRSFLSAVESAIINPQKQSFVSKWFTQLAMLVTNGSFVTKSLTDIQELSIFSVRSTKNYFQLDQDEQIWLVLFLIIYKFVVRRLMPELWVNLRSKRLEKDQQVKIQYMLKDVACYLQKISKELLKNFCKRTNRNFQNLEDLIKKLQRSDKMSWLKLQDKKHRKKQIKQIVEKAQNFHKFQSQFKEQIIEICRKARLKICQYKREHYRRIKETILSRKVIIRQRSLPSNSERPQLRQKLSVKKNQKLQEKFCEKVQRQTKTVGLMKGQKQNEKIEGKNEQDKKREFNLDIINRKSQERKQDYIRQRFRNILGRQN